jgi:hypothetical protein
MDVGLLMTDDEMIVLRRTVIGGPLSSTVSSHPNNRRSVECPLSKNFPGNGWLTAGFCQINRKVGFIFL